jgi:uncharacterized protein (DUF927 family)
MIEGKEAQQALYGLSNGAGKQRAGRSGDLREPKSWRVLALSTGELPVESKLSQERGQKAMAGQLVRMLDIPADRGRGFGAFDSAGGFDDAAKLSQAIKQAAKSAYGTLGPAFVRMIVTMGADKAVSFLRNYVDAFVGQNVDAGADGQVKRAAMRIALIAGAGEFAATEGLAPWGVGEADAAAQWALCEWVRLRGGSEAAEVGQAIAQVRRFIVQHGASRFEPHDAADSYRVQNRVGWIKKRADGERIFCIPPDLWKSEVCSGLDPSHVAAILAKIGMLIPDKGKLARPEHIGSLDRSIRVYVVRAAIIEGAE